MYSKIVPRLICVLWILVQFSFVNINAKVESDQIHNLNTRLYNKLGNVLLQRIGKSLASGVPLADIPELDPLVILNKMYFLSELDVPGLSGLIRFREIEITGLTNVVLKNFELIENEIEDTAVISGKLTFPEISIVAYYTFKADYYPLFDDFCIVGRFSGTITDFTIDGETAASIYDEGLAIYQHNYDISTSVGGVTIDTGYTTSC